MDRSIFSENRSLVLGTPVVDYPVVVGIDFGTTYSGISFAYKNLPGNLSTSAPSARGTQCKVPTILMHSLTSDTWHFGNDALDQSSLERGEYDSFILYKLGLVNASNTEVMITSEQGREERMSTLLAKTLLILKTYAMSKIEAGYGPQLKIRSAADVQWVLTIPAIWNDHAKMFMKKAARDAGLMGVGALDSKNVVLVDEPEGGALDTHVNKSFLTHMKVGEIFLVVDCGGGTIDVTVHKIFSINPLKMDCISIPEGGTWGSSFINKMFKKFLKNLFEFTDERTFSNHERSHMADYKSLYDDFELAKCNFTGNFPVSFGQDLFSGAELAQKVERYVRRHPNLPCSSTGRRLQLSIALMLSFYEDLLVNISNLVRSILALPDCRGLQEIILVGGFSSSTVLRERLTREFATPTMQVICPSHPQEAIVQGAVHYGLYQLIRNRLAMRTLAVGCRMNGIDNCLDVLVRKNEVIPDNHVVSWGGLPPSDETRAIVVPVYSSTLENPTREYEGTMLGHVNAVCPRIGNQSVSDRRMTVTFNFRAADIYVDIVDSQNQRTTGSIALV